MTVRLVLLSAALGLLSSATLAAPTRLKCESKAPTGVERFELEADPEAKALRFVDSAGWSVRQTTVVVEPTHVSWTAFDAQKNWRYMRLDRKTLQLVEPDKAWTCVKAGAPAKP